MAIEQSNKQKVRPVMDYREFHYYITAHTAEADVCAEQLRRQRRRGKNVTIVDLRRAYLQLHVDERLWPFQTVLIDGTRYCLTRMGFGLSVAPEVMRAVVKMIRSVQLLAIYDAHARDAAGGAVPAGRRRRPTVRLDQGVRRSGSVNETPRLQDSNVSLQDFNVPFRGVPN